MRRAASTIGLTAIVWAAMAAPVLAQTPSRVNVNVDGIGNISAPLQLVLLLTLLSFLPAFLVDERGYSLAQAAFITSLITLLGVFSAPLSGWLSDISGSRRTFIAIPFLVIAALLVVPFRASGAAIYAFVLFFGAVSGATPAVSFTAVPEVMGNARRSAMGVAIVSIGATLGSVLGPISFGLFAERAGWVTAGYALIPFCLAGFGIAWVVRVR